MNQRSSSYFMLFASHHITLDWIGFNHSRDMVGAHQKLNGSRYLTTFLLGMVCDPWARTCYEGILIQ